MSHCTVLYCIAFRGTPEICHRYPKRESGTRIPFDAPQEIISCLSALNRYAKKLVDNIRLIFAVFANN
jgi:hypothetical protein